MYSSAISADEFNTLNYIERYECLAQAATISNEDISTSDEVFFLVYTKIDTDSNSNNNNK